MTPPPHERGFVLVSAMWLLILAGAIAAVLIMRARTDAIAVSAAERTFRADVAGRDAVQIVVADLLFAGPRSRWALLPAKGTVVVDAISVPVSITSEAGRLDLNAGDLPVIDGALQGLGVAARERAGYVGALDQRRRTGHRIASWAEAETILALAHATTTPCLGDYFTLTSGLHRPRDTDLAPELARALGVATAAASVPVAPGTALRIAAGDAATLTMVVRITGDPNSPYQVLALARGRRCVA